MFFCVEGLDDTDEFLIGDWGWVASWKKKYSEWPRWVIRVKKKCRLWCHELAHEIQFKRKLRGLLDDLWQERQGMRHMSQSQVIYIYIKGVEYGRRNASCTSKDDHHGWLLARQYFPQNCQCYRIFPFPWVQYLHSNLPFIHILLWKGDLHHSSTLGFPHLVLGSHI